MKLSDVRKIEEEAAEGATSAGTIAASYADRPEAKQLQKQGKKGKLFQQHPLLKRKRMVGKTPIIRYQYEPNFEEFSIDQKYSMDLYESNREDFNPTDILSRLSAGEKFAKNYDNTIVYGLEDDEGNVVKVYIPKEQAEDFEASLARQKDDQRNKEIAELLFSLKDDVDIVNVVWPEIEEDEEEGELADEGDLEMGGEGDLEGLEGDEGGEGGDDEGGVDLEGEGNLPTPSEDTQKMQGTLDQIIDLLKSQAEAQTAEAEAKAAEARAKEADAAARSAEAKIKAEEEILDMEAHFKKQKTEDKETKKLAKLAQFRHEVTQAREDDLKDQVEAESLTPEAPDMSKVQDFTAAEDEEVAATRLIDFLIRSQRGQE